MSLRRRCSRDTGYSLSCMSPGEGEPRRAMVERGSPPACNGRVAQRAILRETCRRMGRAVGRIVIGRVAREARGRQPDKDVVLVACVARHVYMRTRQRELGLGCVIKRRTAPACNHRVAQRAILREARRHMVRIVGSLEVRQVTRDAGRRQPRKHVVLVTRLQVTLTCAPVSGNLVAVLWLNVAPPHPATTAWHSEQSCGKPAAAWVGFFVPFQSARWHEMQVVDSPA